METKYFTMRGTGQLKEVTKFDFTARVNADEKAYGLATVVLLNVAGSKERGATHDSVLHVPQLHVRNTQGTTNFPLNIYRHGD